jgi:hypothetical protein
VIEGSQSAAWLGGDPPPSHSAHSCEAACPPGGSDSESELPTARSPPGGACAEGRPTHVRRNVELYKRRECRH